MGIEVYIAELLYRNSCVIIPGFGGFIGNIKSVQIHPTQHTFIPPQKHILFNKNLTSNDGVLYNHIAQKLQVSYTKAQEICAQYVKEIQAKLGSDETVVFPTIGKLSKNIESNLQFTPQNTSNFELGSFGLKTLQVNPIHKIERTALVAEKPVEKGVVPHSPKTMSVTEKIGLGGRYAGALATLILVGLLLFQIPLWNNKLNDSNMTLLPASIIDTSVIQHQWNGLAHNVSNNLSSGFSFLKSSFENVFKNTSTEEEKEPIASSGDLSSEGVAENTQAILETSEITDSLAYIPTQSTIKENTSATLLPNKENNTQAIVHKKERKQGIYTAKSSNFIPSSDYFDGANNRYVIGSFQDETRAIDVMNSVEIPDAKVYLFEAPNGNKRVVIESNAPISQVKQAFPEAWKM